MVLRLRKCLRVANNKLQFITFRLCLFPLFTFALFLFIFTCTCLKPVLLELLRLVVRSRRSVELRNRICIALQFFPIFVALLLVFSMSFTITTSLVTLSFCTCIFFWSDVSNNFVLVIYLRS